MIADRILAWYDQNKRIFPFRGTRDPYAVWVSEIMLQQTRTETAGAYYQRFMERFPTVGALAFATEQAVLKVWEGLGYYSRARNMHRAAQLIVRERGGEFPGDIALLQALPGIGAYTAAAIASIAFDTRVPAMDGNLIRVMSRLSHTADSMALPSAKRALYRYALSVMPLDRCGDFNQAMMDLGACICVPGTPDCALCPLAGDCGAFAAGDAEALPLLPRAVPPRAVDVAVSIITCEDKVLLYQRREKLLCGLWVFALGEGACTAGDVISSLTRQGLAVNLIGHIGSARHVFTHRIWNMELYHFAAAAMVGVSGAEWVTLAELDALPLPIAMRAAKKKALSILGARKLDHGANINTGKD
jgi:A/G-specific adenine glycosylase